jgi:hypothetical protein
LASSTASPPSASPSASASHAARPASIIDAYFEQFPGIQALHGSIIADAKQHGYVETLTGRRRYIRDITAPTPPFAVAPSASP